MDGYLILSNAFSVSVNIITSLVFTLFLWWIMLVYFHILNQPCIPGMSSLWLWYFSFFSNIAWFIYSCFIADFFFFFCLFAFSRAAPVAYGDSQIRGIIGAVATRATATWDPSHVCILHQSSQQCWILNPLSKARDRTGNPMVPSRIC